MAKKLLNGGSLRSHRSKDSTSESFSPTFEHSRSFERGHCEVSQSVGLSINKSAASARVDGLVRSINTVTANPRRLFRANVKHLRGRLTPGPFYNDSMDGIVLS
ncbi:hypothetical protein EVAR_97961_1 [Eumeta japonica]|uniref:Uncharacterized protein n=1 Tax=Eumeta variegata TaxID=151549 RepID=A0A4C1XFW9_EUMVA|nr:hypothetical protein EVAR_97961_1 [Eumeta japonica]